jgi:hypothetical protein
MTPSPNEVKALVERLAKPHFIADDVFARTPEPIHELIALFREEREDAAIEITRLQAERDEAEAELRRIVALDDEADTKRGGLADCSDNDGHPYQSQALANCLARARALIPPPSDMGEEP